ncbi:MAG: hypothetical protein KH031_23985 [Clostridiales bacterium]|nr:hypothetical protein [Clostridiales bacterium]
MFNRESNSTELMKRICLPNKIEAVSDALLGKIDYENLVIVDFESGKVEDLRDSMLEDIIKYVKDDDVMFFLRQN